MSPSNRQQVFEIVRGELARIVREQSPDFDADIGMDTLLTADLGLDSISFIEVAVALEKALCVDELPLGSWTERESDRDGQRFTVASLVDLCTEHLSAGGFVTAGTGEASLSLQVQ